MIRAALLTVLVGARVAAADPGDLAPAPTPGHRAVAPEESNCDCRRCGPGATGADSACSPSCLLACAGGGGEASGSAGAGYSNGASAGGTAAGANALTVGADAAGRRGPETIIGDSGAAGSLGALGLGLMQSSRAMIAAPTAPPQASPAQASPQKQASSTATPATAPSQVISAKGSLSATPLAPRTPARRARRASAGRRSRATTSRSS